jgi:polyisoprenyl-phosphate glycosyltransferase
MLRAVPKLSVVVPVYRGADTITELVEKLGEELLPSFDFEMVLVEDCSPDNSGEVMRGLAARYEWVVCLHLSRNFGEHNAVLAGLNHASGDYVVIMDDDLQNPPSEVRRLVDELVAGYDVVYSRYEKKQHHWFRNFGSWLNDRVANVMLGKPRNLYLSSFKAISRFVVDQVIKFDGPFPYIDGLILRTTRNIKAVTVEHHQRAVGTSGYTLTKLVRLWVNMFTSFSILPLRVASLFGLLVAFAGALLAVAFAIERLNNPALPLGWASVVILVLLLAGVQLFALGMLGEYLGRMFLKIGGEPQFVVRTTRNWARDSASPGASASVSGAGPRTNEHSSSIQG